MLLSAVPMMILCGVVSNGQTVGDTCKVVEALPAGEFILECAGAKLRTVTADHIREIQIGQAHAAALEKENALLRDEVESLKRQTTLQAQLAAIDARITALKDDQLAQSRLLIAGQKETIAGLNAIRGEQPKKSFLDKLPVRFGIALLGVAANGRTAFNPCTR